MLTDKQQAKAAAEFAKEWEGRGDEKSDSQPFWLSLLSNVFGISHPEQYIRFEGRVMLDSTSFIDGYIDATHVMIEQKGMKKDLFKKIKQSDGEELTPFEQAKRYANALPYSKRPRWIITCNFKTFLVYDMEHPKGDPFEIQLANLGKEYYRLQFLVDEKSADLHQEERVSVEAGKIVGRIHKALMAQYDDDSPEAQRWLNILCVRIVFCLYAEDAGIFSHDQFYHYLAGYETKDMRSALLRLFEVLNTPEEKRSRYLMDDLKAFPYTNGGLFKEEIEIPQFTDELRNTLLQNASLDFDWSEISPTIFGGVFESTLNPETRRSGGMHYTSIENIHKVIDPLFLNDLRDELNLIKEEKVERSRNKKLLAYQDKLASLTFLDPACGSGNFLTETYLSLRRLENEAISELYHGQSMMGEFINPVKVSINQFYGIEINDFAVTVATTALWISESQMLTETEKIIRQDLDFLPLKSYFNIREGNALRMEWDEIEVPSDIPTIHVSKTYLTMEEKPLKVSEPIVEFDEINLVTPNIQPGPKPKETNTYKVHYDYIIGNPPFIGARWMNQEQKSDVSIVFGENWSGAGDLDYVACWYKKSSDLMIGTTTKAALVSTNSITQGGAVANLWKPLMKNGIHIDFAWRTFKWDNEATQKAHVHCVIVGFSRCDNKGKELVVYDNDNEIKAKHINAYLMDAPDVFVGNRQQPLFDVPEIGIGNKPIDGGYYLFEREEMECFVKEEPASAAYFHPYYGAVEFIHQRPRYCLWLGDCSPAELRKMPLCMKRIEAVREYRLASKSPGTVKLADRPTRFHVENMPKGNYIVIPQVSSQNRDYIPMGYMDESVICSDKVRLMPGGTLYHFGILESSVHMSWMRTICTRLKSDYSYTVNNVYNNFPWPKPTEEQKNKIEQTAQAILDARALYPDSSFADLYDKIVMPVELRKAHQANDKAVMEAYGFPPSFADDESLIVAELFKLYQQLTEGKAITSAYTPTPTQ